MSNRYKDLKEVEVLIKVCFFTTITIQPATTVKLLKQFPISGAQFALLPL